MEEEGLLEWHCTSGKLSATMMGHALHKLGKTRKFHYREMTSI